MMRMRIFVCVGAVKPNMERIVERLHHEVVRSKHHQKTPDGKLDYVVLSEPRCNSIDEDERGGTEEYWPVPVELTLVLFGRRVGTINLDWFCNAVHL